MTAAVAMKRMLTRHLLVAIGIIATGALSTKIEAATITNRDAVVHQVTVLIGDVPIQHRRQSLKPGISIKRFCLSGCTIRIGDSPKNDFILDGTERISIERGVVYFDGDEKAAAKIAPGQPR